MRASVREGRALPALAAAGLIAAAGSARAQQDERGPDIPWYDREETPPKEPREPRKEQTIGELLPFELSARVPERWWLPFLEDSRWASTLKGGAPIGGTEDLYLSLGAVDRFTVQWRDLPTPTGLSGSGSVSPDFFGSGKQTYLQNDLVLFAELSRRAEWETEGDWKLRLAPIVRTTALDVSELGVVSLDPDDIDREDHQISLAEGYFEYRWLEPWDGTRDTRVELGILPFRSDFRGFVFHDANLGGRATWTASDESWTADAAVFSMLDRDTNSQLLELDESRDQLVAIARVEFHDWAPVKGELRGYDTQFSLHWSDDERGTHFDDNGFPISPPAFGAGQPHEVEAFYLGWAGEGKLGPVDVSHAVYEVLGEDTLNPIAAQELDINAQLAALEVGWNLGPFRMQGFGLYASGDDDPLDDAGEGFDAILDAPIFAGSRLSFWTTQAFDLVGTNLKSALSPLPDLSPSGTEGQAGFVNPGLDMVGLSAGIEPLPGLLAQGGVSYLAFDDTDSLEALLGLSDISRDIGWEFFLGAQYWPGFAEGLAFEVGASVLFPGEGLQRMYQSDEALESVIVGLSLGA